ncbi:lipoprotein [Cobetia sp. 3AK]|uniref:LPS translocon maturation chaperone LptM n=1 Tax=Cobetia sp. 3AK TaxID=3040020 RepID=UPI00244BCA84|nr:lipoprotein [Cobetia sp. 3AK]MDH2374366.1 lipoprotein [Cobetia sp. 3AK]
MRHLMSQSARHALRTLAGLLLGAGLLTGCGQKGPLYLPADADAGSQRAEAPAPAPAAAETERTAATETSGSDA